MNVDPDTTVAGQINEDRGSHQLFHIENKDKLILHLLWIRNPTRPSSKACEVGLQPRKDFHVFYSTFINS